MDAKEKSILITGASGFIGSGLVCEAIKRGYRTFAAVRKTSKRQYLDHPAIHFIEMDFNDPAAMDDVLRAFDNRYGRPDFIVHAAGITKALHPMAYREVNVEYTSRLVSALFRRQLVPDKFVFISSLSSFGPGANNSPITLYQDRTPISNYGRSKLEVEQFLYTLPRFPFVIINPTAVYGPRDRGFLMVLRCMQKHLDLRIADAGRQLSFLHVEDLCQAVYLCLESAPLRRQFLVSDLGSYTQKDFSDAVRSCLGKRTMTLTLPKWVAGATAVAADVLGRISGRTPLLTTDRLKEFAASNWGVDCSEMVNLGYRPRFDLQQGLDQTIRWYREHGWI